MIVVLYTNNYGELLSIGEQYCPHNKSLRMKQLTWWDDSPQSPWRYSQRFTITKDELLLIMLKYNIIEYDIINENES